VPLYKFGHTSLKSVTIRGNTNIGDKGAFAFSQVIKFNSVLKSIHLDLRTFLRNNSIGTFGVISIAQALKFNTSLESIYLNFDSRIEQGIEALADALKFNTSLQSVHLNVCLLEDEEMWMIADVLKVNTVLQNMHLSIQWYGIGDLGVKAIAEMIELNRTLQSIKLGHLEIKQLRSIATSLKRNTLLQKCVIEERLNFSHDREMEDCIEEIRQLIRKNVVRLNSEQRFLSVCLFVDMKRKKRQVDFNVLAFEVFPLMGFAKLPKTKVNSAWQLFLDFTRHLVK
jgi:hypothetical protein